MPVSDLSQLPYTGLAGGISVITPLTLGSRRYDSCRGGVEGHRPVYGGGCLCLWKRGRKRRPMPPHGVRCSLACVCSVSKKPSAGAGSHGHPSSSWPCLGGPKPTRGGSRAKTQASPHPLGCLPKRLCCCSGTTEKRDFRKSKLCFENQDLLQMPTALEVVECVC